MKVAVVLPEARPGHWRRRGLIVFACCAWAVTLFGLAPRAWAYRPFDGTDAAVAETGELEIAGRQDEALEEHVNLLELRLGLTFSVFRKNGR